jgi:hypothetical protein
VLHSAITPRKRTPPAEEFAAEGIVDRTNCFAHFRQAACHPHSATQQAKDQQYFGVVVAGAKQILAPGIGHVARLWIVRKSKRLRPP